MEYDSSLVYLNSATSIAARLAKVRQIIDGLLTMAVKAAETGNYEFYELDDGQTRVYTKYRNNTDIAAAIKAYQAMEQRYLNQLNGRTMVFVDSKNFR